MGTRYGITMKCKTCGYTVDKTMEVWGDFDGWSEDDCTILEKDCPCCKRIKEYKFNIVKKQTTEKFIKFQECDPFGDFFANIYLARKSIIGVRLVKVNGFPKSREFISELILSNGNDVYVIEQVDDILCMLDKGIEDEAM